MPYLFLAHPTCSTVARARKWLDQNKISYHERNIVRENPTILELKSWIALNQKPIGQFFNTSGMIYRSLNIKDKRLTLNEEEQINLLASNGMLIKRPLLIGNDFILIGFRENEWKKVLSQ